MVKVERELSCIRVVSPYSADFVRRARRLAGEWDGRAWVFPLEVEEPLLELLNRIYGYVPDGTTANARVYRVEAVTEVRACRRPVTWNDRVLAAARGRDTGAYTGRRVVLIGGRITSGGSVKNWETIVCAGAVFLVLNCLFEPQGEDSFIHSLVDGEHLCKIFKGEEK